MLSMKSHIQIIPKARCNRLVRALSSMSLASRNRRAENVRVFAVIIAKLEFGNIQRHVFAADLVQAPDNAALKDRPEAFNCVGVNGTNNDRIFLIVGHASHILALFVIDRRVRKFVAKMLVANPTISAEQADLVRNGFADEFGKRIGAHVLNDTGHDIALTPHGTDDRSFARTDTAGSAALAALVLVLVARQSADESFVNLDYAAKLFNVLNERDTDLVTHAPRGFVRTETAWGM